MKRHSKRWLPIAILGCMAPILLKANALPRLRVHPEGHYLMTESQQPFFWLGDTGWFSMFRGTDAEVDYYLRTRAEQEFNVIQIMLLPECDSIRTPGQWGELPFENQDPQQPREAYFKHVDQCFKKAESLGLYVAVVLVWGDKITAPWGDGPRLFTKDNLPVAESFARWIGQRYKNQSNLIWILGGDRPPQLGGHPAMEWTQTWVEPTGFAADEDFKPIWRAMAQGLTAGLGADGLIGYHPQGGEASTSVFLHQENWLDFNAMQSGHGGGYDMPVWQWINRDWNLEPAKPTYDSEPNYEDHPYNPWPKWDASSGYLNDYDVRKQCYRSVFAGGFGVTYGHHSVWQWACERYDPINHPAMGWLEALHRPGAQQVKYLRRLVESRPFFTRIPDQSLVVESDHQQGFEHMLATRDQAATYAMIYVPMNRYAFSLNLTPFAGKTLTCHWYDPQNGFAHPAGEVHASGIHQLKSPAKGKDWVLVLDDKTADYGTPGTR